MIKQWENCSTYSRGDKERIPSVWKVKVGNLSICVHRHIHHPGKWLLSCDLFFNNKELKPEGIEQAKCQAVAMVQVELQKAIDDIIDDLQDNSAPLESDNPCTCKQGALIYSALQTKCKRCNGDIE